MHSFMVKMSAPLKKIMVCLLMACTWNAVLAQTYVELGASVVDYTNTFAGARIETRQHISNVVIGREIAPDWSAELMTGLLKISDDPVYLNGAEIKNLSIKFSNTYGVYLKRQQAVSEHVGLFVRAGYASVKGSASYQGISDSFAADGASYGLGAVYQMGEEKYLNFNYLSFLEKDNLKIKVLGVHYGQRF
jgi:Outer membrane protein beta-barrel domain